MNQQQMNLVVLLTRFPLLYVFFFFFLPLFFFPKPAPHTLKPRASFHTPAPAGPPNNPLHSKTQHNNKRRRRRRRRRRYSLAPIPAASIKPYHTGFGAVTETLNSFTTTATELGIIVVYEGFPSAVVEGVIGKL